MEKINYNANQQNLPNKLFLILSIVSWLLISINNLASLKWLYREPNVVWNIYACEPKFIEELNKELQNASPLPGFPTPAVQLPPTPFQLESDTIFKIFNFFFIITFIGCATFIYQILVKKDQAIIDGMFGKYSKFHFIPLLLGFIMSLLGELSDIDNFDDIAYTGLAISIVGLACMIYIYINTNINSNDWWVNYVLNKGTFSCLIILFWYNFCYDIYLVRVSDKPEDTDIKWSKGINLAFSIIFGIGSIAFSYVFKDIIICLINIYIYKDLAKNNIHQYSEEDPTEKQLLKDVNYNADGAIDMIILICSFLLLIYLIVEKVKGIIDQMKNQIAYLDSYQKQIAAGINTHTQSINSIVNMINSNQKNQ